MALVEADYIERSMSRDIFFVIKKGSGFLFLGLLAGAQQGMRE